MREAGTPVRSAFLNNGPSWCTIEDCPGPDNGCMPAFPGIDRLVLRGFTEGDVDHLYDLNGDRDVMWFLTGGEPTPREEVRSRIIPFFLSFCERYGGLGFRAAEPRSASRLPRLVSSPASRGRRRRPWLPAAQGGVEPGLRHRGIARPHPQVLYRTRRTGSRSWHHRSFGINRSAEMGAAGQRGGQAGRQQQIFQEAAAGHSDAWVAWLASGRCHARAWRQRGARPRGNSIASWTRCWHRSSPVT